MKAPAPIIFLALITMGCGQPPAPIPPAASWSIGVAAESDDDLAVIQLYDDLFGLPLFVLDPNGIRIVTVPRLADDTPDDAITVSGKFFPQTALIEILDTVTTGDHYQQILAHELGHALGCGHIDGTIMQPVTDFTRTTEDLIIETAFTDWVQANYPPATAGE